jgi:hypothetical protein
MQEDAENSDGLKRLEVLRKLNAKSEWINYDLLTNSYSNTLAAYSIVEVTDSSPVSPTLKVAASCEAAFLLRALLLLEYR